MPTSLRLVPILAVVFATAAHASAQSTLFVLDTARQELIRSTTTAAAPVVVGATGALVEAADFDAPGRTLWCIGLDRADRVAGTLDLDTGVFARWSGPLVLGPVTALAAAPHGAEWLIAEAHAGGARVWRGHLPTGTLTLLATLTGGGAIDGLAVGLDGAALLLRADELFTLDRVTGANSTLGAFALASATGRATSLEFDWASGELFTVFPSGAGDLTLARIDLATAAATAVGQVAGVQAGVGLSVRRGAEDATTGRFCAPGAPNASGRRGRIEARGSADSARGDLVLAAHDLPPQSFGLFLASRERAAPSVPAGSVGSLCLGGAIGRIANGAQLFATGPNGEYAAALDFAALPQPFGATPIEPWERWSFQAWYRDSVNSVATSNFTDAVHVAFTERFVGEAGAPTHGWRGIPEGSAHEVEFGDLDGDGFVDLVIAGTGPELVVRRGPSFEVRHAHSNGSFPRSLVLADLDQDGHLDALTSADAQGRVWVHWNDGAGALSAMSALVACGLVGELSAADFDGDGRLDVLAECEGGHQAVVLFNEGARAFAPRQFVSLQLRTGALRAADMDGDGLADIVGVGRDVDLAVVVRANGGRAFANPVLFASRRAEDARLVDLDLDGRVDLVAVQSQAPGLVLHAGLGGGTLGPPIVVPILERAISVAAADLSGDGLPELITGYAAARVVRVHGNLGGFAFATGRSSLAGGGTRDVAVADVDGDGWPDVAAAHEASQDFHVTLLRGSSAGLEGRPLRMPLAHDASTVTEGDVDGDGETDLLLSGKFGDVFELHRGDGQGGLAAPIAISLPSFETSGERTQLADLNGDGRLDIVALTTGSRRAWTLLQTSLAPGVPVTFATATSTEFPTTLSDVALADVDGDGDLDLVGVGSFNGLAIAENDGSGAFAAPFPVYDPTYFKALVVLDLDGDGWVDACGPSSFDRLAIMWGNGPASFDPSVLYGTGAEDIVAADFDHDGWVDLATLRSGVHLRTGARMFEVHNVPHLLSAENLVARDLDADGLLDLAWNDPQYRRVGIARNLGRGEFGHVNVMHPCANPGAPSFADLDQDGAPELYIGDYFSSALVVLPHALTR